MHFTQPVAQDAAVVRRVHRRAAVAAERLVRANEDRSPVLIRDLLVLFGLAGWALSLPVFASEFVVSMALTCLMYVALASSWATVLRRTRYLSLATSAFFGIGAYTSALSLEHAAVARSSIVLGAVVATAVARRHGRGRAAPARHLLRRADLRHDRADPPCGDLLSRSRSPGTVGRVLTVVPERDTVYLTVLGAGGADRRRCRSLCGAAASAWRCWASAPTSSARRRWASNTRLVKIAGFALTRRLRRRGRRGDGRALDLHRPAHGVQPLHRLPDRADRA